MPKLNVTYSVNGLIGPMTDTVTVSDVYSIDEVTQAVEELLTEVSLALNETLSLRRILFARPHRS